MTFGNSLDRDLIEASDYADLAPELEPQRRYRCHENAFLAQRFLARLGYPGSRLVHGIYHRYDDQPLHHSWIELRCNCERAVIEMDTRQLRRRGGYPDDEMPDPPLAFLTPHVIAESGGGTQLKCLGAIDRVVLSSQVLMRYEEHPIGPPEDFSADALAALAPRLDEHWAEFVRQAREYDET